MWDPCCPVLVTGLALLLTFPALSMYHGYGFVQYDRLEDVQAALDGEKGRLYKGYRLIWLFIIKSKQTGNGVLSFLF